jgi:tetratricopeptide (TPR) repeat protein
MTMFTPRETLTTGPAVAPLVGLLSDSSFAQLVNDALRNCQSTLALSRSPLANSALVTPTLVKDEASPTAEERGHGLRLVLQWAVNLLAPAPPAHPLGVYRPFDDPTWRDPRWWRYNILRHRYLDPLHPDDFVGGGRYTESLLALTGISSADAFFDERNRAIRIVADRLRQQLIDGQATGELQRLALQETVLALEKQPEPAHLLGIAATFDDIFPRALLMEMAAQEPLRQPQRALDALIAQRLLLTGDEGASLWLAPVLRTYLYELQPRAERQRRHRIVAAHYEAQGAALPAARQWRRAEQDGRAVRLILPAVPELIHDLQLKGLVELLQGVKAKRLDGDQWCEVQFLLSDLYQRSGQFEEALAACRQALAACADATKQACAYRRMGKLYESRNQLHALRYYQQAIERFQPVEPATASLFAEVLKDRGWIHILRNEWGAAERDLLQALQVAPPAAKVLQADLYDALANLYRKTGDHGQALAYAERGLAVREEVGDRLQVAKSLGNLGFLYRAMGEYCHAIAAHQEAMTTYQQLGNQELVAVAWLNIGAVHFLEQCLETAVDAYRQSLAIAQAIALPLIELKAHYNLAEAFSALHQHEHAAAHWQAGYQLCRRHDFDDHEADFAELRQAIKAPVGVAVGESSVTTVDQPQLTTLATLDEDEEFIVALAQREPLLTPKRLMHATKISRATATRRLTRLVEKGWLAPYGKGRSAHYRLATAPANPDRQAVALPPEPAATTIETMIATVQPQLRQRYAVQSLELAPLAAAPRYVRLTVCFDQPPDLESYLNLKRHLSTMLQVEVDLLPEWKRR